jgi:CarD family transcriptional regulator
MFKIGDVVVYPIHGVARITDIREEKIGDSYRLCYILETEIKTTNVRPVIKLPVDKAESNRVRKIVEEYQVGDILEILKHRAPKVDPEVVKRRQREYQEKMRSGSIYQAAEVYRDLMVLKETKELSHGERRWFDEVRNRLIEALLIADETKDAETKETLAEIFKSDPSRKLHLISRENQWIVKEEKAERATKVFETQAEAILYAKDVAKRTHDTEVVIHRRDGSVETRLDPGSLFAESECA